jgi:hypothetical protein
MKVFLHRADERGSAQHGWLHSRFSFSFAEYHNPNRMGFGVLRVINDDIIEASGGFGMHPHRDMEIVTIVLKGSLEHKDSQGNYGITTAGQIQYMSAGSGIQHSEYNPSGDETVELFQIWIHPHTKGLPPRYEQRDFRDLDTHNRWAVIISGDGREGSMSIRQDTMIVTARLDAGCSLLCEPTKANHGRLLLVVEGEITVGEQTLKKRDEVQIISEESFEITASSDAHVLMFDVPMSISAKG